MDNSSATVMLGLEGMAALAVQVLDTFHVVRLGLAAVDDVSRRVQQQAYGHRGRRDDPLYGICASCCTAESPSNHTPTPLRGRLPAWLRRAGKRERLESHV